MLVGWLDRLEIRVDPHHNLLRWSVPGSTALSRAPDMTLAFMPSGQVKVTITDRVSRVVSFLNTQTDDEQMQQLLDLLVNCWAEQSIIGLDLSDVIAVLEASEHGVIANVDNVKMLPDYVTCWPSEFAPLLGSGKISSLQCIYREYQPAQEDFSRYAFAVESLATNDAVVVVGIMPTKKPDNEENAVLYFGFSRVSD
ncbi:hypothetical protein [Nitrincola tapanii]|uniref:Uncharacterized protein n=1 Tax=Nitrincola tapanii TaxID=1708751 RepID=A0A5A9W350_9GAMM|nr:hypothetical protein [Nitrincola tapanii]KAA0875022.1 hypothetical protein E1H14_06275 [Nitrincola tapanii]